MHKNIPLILALMAGVAALLLVLWGYSGPAVNKPLRVEKPATTLCKTPWGCYGR